MVGEVAFIGKLIIALIKIVSFAVFGVFMFKGHYSKYSDSFDKHMDEVVGTACGGASGLYVYFSHGVMLDIDIVGISMFLFGVIKAIGFSAMGSTVGFFVSKFLKKRFEK